MPLENNQAGFSPSFKETDFLKQVGKTVSGKPITHDQLTAIFADICIGLEIGQPDFVLDLGCGNGFITSMLAGKCSAVIGVDRMESLLKIAREYNQPENVTYYQLSILDPALKACFPKDRAFTKILMYEALQHFTEADLPKILDLIRGSSAPGALAFLASIPDKDRLWDFYDTDEKRAMYQIRKNRHEEKIGTWWDKKLIEKACRENGFGIQFLSQNPLLHTAYYRFDVRLSMLAK